LGYDFNFDVVFAAYPQLLSGLWVTLELSFGAMCLGFLVAVVLAGLRTSGLPVLKTLISIYVEVIRNTPFLVQIFFIFFGLPTIGVKMSPFEAALLTMVVNVAAYATEIVRAGIESINKGQIEAATALGLRRIQTFRLIVLKPALRAIYPALTSQFIHMMLMSSAVSVIAANDLAAMGDYIQSETFAAFEVYIVITAIYFALSTAFSALFSAIYKLAFAYPVGR
jgi:polar amino acid transport system permease protein